MPDSSCSHIVVADIDAAQDLAIELLRNVLVAHSQANILVMGVDSLSRMHSFLVKEVPKYGARTDYSKEYWDICIVGGETELTIDGEARLVVALPRAYDAIASQLRVEISLGDPVGEVIIVPGTAHAVGGMHILTAETFERIRRAEKIVSRKTVRALILSGWNGQLVNSQSEAVQMLNAWRGPRVPIILDEAARTTAENALWSARLVEALGDVKKVRVITAWVSSLRMKLASVIAFRSARIVPILSIVWGRAQAASWRPAIVGLLHLRRHIRVGRAVIANGVHHGQAQL